MGCSGPRRKRDWIGEIAASRCGAEKRRVKKDKEITVTSEQLNLVRGAVVSELADIREGPLPRITRTAMLSNGTIVIRSEDEIALNWLSERIGHIFPWEHANLRVMCLDALQKRYRAAVDVPGTAAAFLGLLERQNPGISTASWNLILGIPEFSILKLKTRDFKLNWTEQIIVSA
ncbi:hypothetical protein ACFW04_011348 [Cataglyphis niger]